MCKCCLGSRGTQLQCACTRPLHGAEQRGNMQSYGVHSATCALHAHCKVCDAKCNTFRAPCAQTARPEALLDILFDPSHMHNAQNAVLQCHVASAQCEACVRCRPRSALYRVQSACHVVRTILCPVRRAEQSKTGEPLPFILHYAEIRSGQHYTRSRCRLLGPLRPRKIRILLCQIHSKSQRSIS